MISKGNAEECNKDILIEDNTSCFDKIVEDYSIENVTYNPLTRILSIYQNPDIVATTKLESVDEPQEIGHLNPVEEITNTLPSTYVDGESLLLHIAGTSTYYHCTYYSSLNYWDKVQLKEGYEFFNKKDKIKYRYENGELNNISTIDLSLIAKSNGFEIQNTAGNGVFLPLADLNNNGLLSISGYRKLATLTALVNSVEFIDSSGQLFLRIHEMSYTDNTGLPKYFITDKPIREASPTQNGLLSSSLYVKILDLLSKIDSDVYSKTEVDDLLNTKVDKAPGHSLINETELVKLSRVGEYVKAVKFTYNDSGNYTMEVKKLDPSSGIEDISNLTLANASVSGDGLMSKEDKDKLNSLISYHTGNITSEVSSSKVDLLYRVYNPSTKETLVNTFTIPNSTTTTPGLIIGTDKSKLDRIRTYIKEIAAETIATRTEATLETLIYNPTLDTETKGVITINPATQSKAGLMTASDKTKLDTLKSFMVNLVDSEGTTQDQAVIHYTFYDNKVDKITDKYYNLVMASPLMAGAMTSEFYNIISGLDIPSVGSLDVYGTPSVTWQLDNTNGGPKIKSKSGAFELKSADDTSFANLTIKDITIKGDVYQEGESFITKAEEVKVTDNLLTLNNGEVGPGVTKGKAGLEIDRGTLPNFYIIFDESDDRFKVGTEGDLWSLLLRDNEADLKNGYFLNWNATKKRAETTNHIPINGSIFFDFNEPGNLKNYIELNSTIDGFKLTSYAKNLQRDLTILVPQNNLGYFKFKDLVNGRFGFSGTLIPEAPVTLSNHLEANGTRVEDITLRLGVRGLTKLTIAENDVTVEPTLYAEEFINRITGKKVLYEGMTFTSVGDSTLVIYPEHGSEVNFGGTTEGSSNPEIIFFGLRSKDSRVLPTQYHFGPNADGPDASTVVYAKEFWAGGKKLATEEALSKYLPLAGGTMSGDIVFPASYGIKENLTGDGWYLLRLGVDSSTYLGIGHTNSSTYISTGSNGNLYNRRYLDTPEGAYNDISLLGVSTVSGMDEAFIKYDEKAKMLYPSNNVSNKYGLTFLGKTNEQHIRIYHSGGSFGGISLGIEGSLDKVLTLTGDTDDSTLLGLITKSNKLFMGTSVIFGRSKAAITAGIKIPLHINIKGTEDEDSLRLGVKDIKVLELFQGSATVYGDYIVQGGKKIIFNSPNPSILETQSIYSSADDDAIILKTRAGITFEILKSNSIDECNFTTNSSGFTFKKSLGIQSTPSRPTVYETSNSGEISFGISKDTRNLKISRDLSLFNNIVKATTFKRASDSIEVVYKDELKFGDYIPLAGTLTDSPVTGVIELNDNAGGNGFLNKRLTGVDGASRYTKLFFDNRNYVLGGGSVGVADTTDSIAELGCSSEAWYVNGISFLRVGYYRNSPVLQYVVNNKTNTEGQPIVNTYKIYHEGNLNIEDFAEASKYLPLTAGDSKPVTGVLHIRGTQPTGANNFGVSAIVGAKSLYTSSVEICCDNCVIGAGVHTNGTGNIWIGRDVDNVEGKKFIATIDRDDGQFNFNFRPKYSGKNLITIDELNAYVPDRSTTTGDETMTILPSRTNEVNFGGTNSESTIVFGYRAVGAKPIPSTYVFGNNTSIGSATIKAANFLLSGKQVATVDQIPTSLPADGGNADTVDGLHANEIISSGWNTLTTYTYAEGTSVQYYWSKIANVTATSSNNACIEINMASDSNSASGQHSYLYISSFKGGTGTGNSINTFLSSSPGNVNIEVRLDKSGSVWIKILAIWTSYALFRVIKKPTNSSIVIHDTPIKQLTDPVDSSNSVNVNGGISTVSNSGVFSYPISRIHVEGEIRSTSMKPKTLSITSTTPEAHLSFSRAGYNYLYTPSGGAFAFVPNGRSINDSGTLVLINGTGMSVGKGTEPTTSLDVAGITKVTGQINIIPTSSGYKEGIRIASYNGWSSIFLGVDGNASSGTIDGQWVIGKNISKSFCISYSGTEGTGTTPNGLAIKANNAGIFFNGAPLLTGVGTQRIIGTGNLLQLNSTANSTYVEFMKAGVSKGWVGLGSSTTEDLGVVSYTADVFISSNNGKIDLGQVLSPVKVSGNWILGKTRAAIMYNNYSPIDSAAYNILYGMKTTAGNVLTFGGINDTIGFYGILANRTENSTDFSLSCDTNTGNWRLLGNITISKTLEVSRIDIPKAGSSDKISIQESGGRLSFTTNNLVSTIGVNHGSLLVSNEWADAPKVPPFGIYTQGLIHSNAGFKTSNITNLNSSPAHFAADKTWLMEYFITGATNSPGTDPNSSFAVNDGFVLSQYWASNFCIQLASDADGSGFAYRKYDPASGTSLSWNFLATTAWVKSQLGSSSVAWNNITGKPNAFQPIAHTHPWDSITSKRIDGSNNTSPQDCNALQGNGIYYYNSNGPTTSIGASSTDGALYQQEYSNIWKSQIAQDYRNGNLYVRGLNSGTWTAWKKMAAISDIPSTFTRSSNGLVPAPGGSSTTRYLREDSTWQTVATGVPTKAEIVNRLNETGEVVMTRHWVFSGGAGKATTSDMRFKNNVKDLPSVLDKVLHAPAFTYNWKEDTQNIIGTSYQYWKEHLPQLTSEISDKDKTGVVFYDSISVVLLKALQEEHKLREEQKEIYESRLREVENKLRELSNYRFK